MTATSMLQEAKLVTVARGVAMDIFPLEQVLSSAGVSYGEFHAFKESPRFVELVEQFAVEWGSAMNTAQRIKVKTQAMIEDVLPSFYTRMTDVKESFAAQVDALKTLRVMSGVGGEEQTSNVGAEKFHLEIHIGEGKPVTIGNGFGDDALPRDLLGAAAVGTAASRSSRVLTAAVKESRPLNFDLGGGIEDE